MTKTNSYAPLPVSPPRSHPDTLYRDMPFAAFAISSAQPRFLRVRAEVLPDDGFSTGILIGLGALLLPTVAYSFAQMMSLVSGGSLEHAVRALLP